MHASLNSLDDFRVAGDDVDPRGWRLLVGTGSHVGEVDDLIVDLDARRVCYLVCALLPAPAAQVGHDRVLIPIGYARLDEEARTVIVDVISDEELTRLPAYRSLPVSEALDSAIHAVFTREEERPK